MGNGWHCYKEIFQSKGRLCFNSWFPHIKKWIFGLGMVIGPVPFLCKRRLLFFFTYSFSLLMDILEVTEGIIDAGSSKAILQGSSRIFVNISIVI